MLISSYEYHTKAKDILDGRRIDPSFYPVIYGLNDDDDWNAEESWYKANPSLGHTITIDRVRDAHSEALTNPAEENVFRQLRLDQWVGSAVAWIPEHIYDRGNLPIDLEKLSSVNSSTARAFWLSATMRKHRSSHCSLSLTETKITSVMCCTAARQAARQQKVRPLRRARRSRPKRCR